ncbi:hypothetical protein [Segatella oris]|uniref:Uncharacterized protein n=1 Tax=Segatella oris C735 TaxID=563008 RepID=D7N9U4_9BACT|nr:hypothetical protein [Segatella oris]EFI49701.1 hypothetical protein HMPREF0665_00425 [Segatella oris C735]
MVQDISKVLFTMTVTAPTFFSLALTGIVKDSKIYYDVWRKFWSDYICPNSFEWWAINGSLLFMLSCIIGVSVYLKYKSRRFKEAKSIVAISYSNMSHRGGEQVLSSVIPWLTVFAEKTDFRILFFCIVLQCCLIAITSYNNSNYNIICSILGYRYYEVHTEENTYILLSKKCIRNKNDIKLYIDITDYMGLIIKNKK